MFTYQITIEYLGTNFVGWQVQKNGLSVQEILEKSLSKYLKDNIRVVGSGRTDAGVHASEQSAHFKTKYKIIYTFSKKQYQYTDEKLLKIKALKDQGEALCDSGKLKEGEAKLMEAIKIISHTRMN